jgi:hypothetical protein
MGTNSSNLGSSFGKDGIMVGIFRLTDSFWAKLPKISSSNGDNSGLGDRWMELIRSSSSSLVLSSLDSGPSSPCSTGSLFWN